ncbi:hypothetical protein, partial [Campylobacter canadensis]|uniref:hypothetical protein n=1 Tax=Campylobacter canadensis TaxID=449520 RepID=UPI001CC96747
KEIHNILTELSKTDTMSFSFGGHKQALGGSIYNEENFINIVNLYNKNNIAQKQKNNINLDTQIMLSKKINIFDYIELCEFYSKKTKGVPFEKNIIVPTIISKDMILNLDECLSKKNQQFIALKIAFENPINNKEIELTYITKHHNCTKINHFFENNEVINCALNLQHNYNNEQKRVFFGDIIVVDSFNSAEEIKNSCKVDFKDDTHFKTKL